MLTAAAPRGQFGASMRPDDALPAAPRNDADNRPFLSWPAPRGRPQYEHWYAVVLHPR